jgi:hypothetical protein
MYGWATSGGLTKVEPVVFSALPDTDCAWIYSAPPPAESTLAVSGAGTILTLSGDWTLDFIAGGGAAIGPDVVPIVDCIVGTQGWSISRNQRGGDGHWEWLYRYYIDDVLFTKTLVAGPPATNAKHYRVCRASGTLRLFVDGVFVASIAAGAASSTSGDLRILQGFCGVYIWAYSLRLLDGIALSTTDDSFTPLTVPLLQI